MTNGRTIAEANHATPEWRLRRLEACLAQLDEKLREAFPSRDIEALQRIFDERHRAKKRIQHVEREMQKQQAREAATSSPAAFIAYCHKGAAAFIADCHTYRGEQDDSPATPTA